MDLGQGFLTQRDSTVSWLGRLISQGLIPNMESKLTFIFMLYIYLWKSTSIRAPIIIIMLEKKKSFERKLTPIESQLDSHHDDSLWGSMIEGIVRPPRNRYSEDQLGDKFIRVKENFYIRYEHQVQHQNKKILLSLFATGKLGYHVILYLHGNASCRIEGTSLLKFMPDNISLACFDFMGCGKNQESQTISLGYRQAEQVGSVVNFLNELGYKVILWGRSMGAATALLYGKAEIIVADSTFKSFKSLCKQVAIKYSPKVVPDCMVSCVFPCLFEKLKKDVHKRAKYDVNLLDVRKAVSKLDKKTMVIFMSGEEDELIHSRNSQKLFKECPCEQKYIKTFEGRHNSMRPGKVMNEVMELILKRVGRVGKDEGE